MGAYKRAVPLPMMLRAEMGRRKLTQEQAALELQVKQPTINRWLNGAAIPKPHYYRRLEAFLDVDGAVIAQAIRLQQLERTDSDERVEQLERRIVELEEALRVAAARPGSVTPITTHRKQAATGGNPKKKPGKRTDAHPGGAEEEAGPP